jgi:hypothetical protein
MRTLLITGSALVLPACGGGRDTGEPTAAAGEDSAHRITAQAVAVGEGMALGAGRYALLPKRSALRRAEPKQLDGQQRQRLRVIPGRPIAFALAFVSHAFPHARAALQRRWGWWKENR